MAERPKYIPPEVITTETEFQLFDSRIMPSPNLNKDFLPYNLVHEYNRYIELKGLFPKNMPIHIEARAGAILYNVQAITPFNPELGHKFNSADWHPTMRAHNLIKNQGVHLQYLSRKLSPLTLSFSIDPEELFSAGIARRWVMNQQKRFSINSDAFKNLAVQVAVPNNELYEAMAEIGADGIYFSLFYPAARGPLAVPKPEDYFDRLFEPVYLRHGLYMQLPSNIDKLSQMKAKFIKKQQ